MKLKNTLWIFLILTPLSVLMRVYELLVMIDPETGFPRPEFMQADKTLLALFFLLFIGFILLCRMMPRFPPDVPKKSFSLAAVSLVTALVMVSELFRMVIADTKGGALFFVQLLLLLATAVYFVLQGFHLLGMVPIARGLTVFPVLWCGVRLGASFIQYTGIAKISENLLDVGMLCLYLCFWLFHGRLWSGISSRKTARWVYGVGLAAALFGVICTAPRWIVSLTGISLHGASVPGAVDFMMAVYIVVFCFAAVRNIKSMRISGEPPAAQTLPVIEPLEDFTGGNGSPQQ